MKNLNNKTISALFFAISSPMFANSLASTNSASVQDSGRGLTLGTGSMAILNSEKSGTLLNASNAASEKMDAGLSLGTCSGKMKTTDKESKESSTVEAECQDLQAHFLMPVGKIGSATNASAVGVIIEKNGDKFKEKDTDLTRENDQMNYSLYGSLGLGMFDLGLKYSHAMFEVITQGTEVEGNETFKIKNTNEDSIGSVTLSLAANINKDLRVAASVTPESLHTNEAKTEVKAAKTVSSKDKVVNGNPLSFAVGAAYQLDNMMLTAGLDRETAKTFKFKNEGDKEIEVENAGFTKLSFGGEMNLDMVKPRAGVSYITSQESKEYGLGLGADLLTGPVVTSLDLNYAKMTDENKESKMEVSKLSMVLGAKASF